MEKKNKNNEEVNIAYDVDRMINEGLSGGRVYRNNIEESIELTEEEEPYNAGE